MSADRLASDDPADDSSAPAAGGYWIFDVDGCLVDSLTGSSLRPGAHELLEHLRETGRRVLLWSAGGSAYAQARAETFGLAHLVDGFSAKDGRDADGFYLTAHLPTQATSGSGLGHNNAVFVDDRPEDLAPDLDVVPVSPYLSDDPFDHGLQPVARRAGLPDAPRR